MTRKHAIAEGLLPNGMSRHDAFALAAAVGFAGVEVLPVTDPSGQAEVKAAIDATGVAVSSVIVGRPRRAVLFDGEGAERHDAVALARCGLRNAVDWGTEVVVVLPGRVDAATSAEVSWQRSAATIGAELAPLAEDLGVTLAVENAWYGFLTGAAEFARYIDELDSPAVGAYFDPGNVFWGHPEHWVATLGSRITGVHYKDFLLRMRRGAGGFGFTMPGDGDIDWARIDRELAAIGYCGWLTQTAVPPPFPLRVANRLDRDLRSRRTGVARTAIRAMARPRRWAYERQLRELRERARARDAALDASRVGAIVGRDRADPTPHPR